jgi:hypothetical protein
MVIPSGINFLPLPDWYQLVWLLRACMDQQRELTTEVVVSVVGRLLVWCVCGI